jgi:hypothetical protein
MRLLIDVTIVGPPSVGGKARDTKGLQQGLPCQEDASLACPKNVGQDWACLGLNRMPYPPLLPGAADKAPQLLHLGGLPLVDDDVPVRSLQTLEQACMDWLEAGRFFLQGVHDGGGTAPDNPGRIAAPTAMERPIQHLLLPCREAALLRVVEEKEVPRTVRVVTPLALWAMTLLARPHDLDPLTVWTMNLYIGHRILL